MSQAQQDHTLARRKPLRIVLSFLVVAISALAVFNVARDGLSSLLITYSAKTKQLAVLDAVQSFNKTDAETYHLQAIMLEARGEFAASAQAYGAAVRLRPRDYLLWLDLAHARELDGNLNGAIGAGRQAVSLAPFYARPHWQLGNSLVRAGQTDEGLKELSIAAANDSTLLPTVIDLDWQLSGGDVEFVKRTIAPKSAEAYRALADFLKRHDKLIGAIEILSAAGSAATTERRELLQELISSRKINEAALLWSADHPAIRADRLLDPGFEKESNLDEPGFGWHREVRTRTITLSLDQKDPNEGQFSLKVDFNGDSESGKAIVSQLVLVNPDTHYQLRFSARSEAIVSSALPYLVVVDAVDNAVLGKPASLPPDDRDWQTYLIDFNCGTNTKAIQIILRRDPCGQSSCPIFGHLWLDNFSLQPVKTPASPS